MMWLMARPRMNREARLLSEFVARNYPTDQVMFNVRLEQPQVTLEGQTLDPAETPALASQGMWVDAIIITAMDWILIEATVEPRWGKVEQLRVYRDSLLANNRFAQWWSRPLRLMLVQAIDVPRYTRMARAEGIEVVTFSPDWVIPALEERFGGRRRAFEPRASVQG